MKTKTENFAPFGIILYSVSNLEFTDNEKSILRKTLEILNEADELVRENMDDYTDFGIAAGHIEQILQDIAANSIKTKK